MKLKSLSVSFLIAILLLTSCQKTYNCTDPIIVPYFIGFAPSDLDSIVIKKFKVNTNYQTFLDSSILICGKSSYCFSYSDTTHFGYDYSISLGIANGYDWQIFIPSLNRTISISNIKGDKKTGTKGWGLFSLDPGPPCMNDLFSATIDGKTTNINYTDTTGFFAYIHK